MSLKIEKRAQEEAVGLVLIVVLIAVIALVFLGFSLRQKPEIKESRQAANLLNAILSYTSRCAVNIEPEYLTIRDLAKSCYSSELCLDGRTTCQALRDTTNSLLNSALSSVSLGSPVTYYNLNMSYVGGQTTQILFLSKGNCSANSIAAMQSVPLNIGEIEISLKLCY